MAHNPTLRGAIEELSRRMEVSLDRLADCIGDGEETSLAVYENAISDSREEILLCYTAGTLEFVNGKDAAGKDVRYGLLDMGLYTLQGELNGRYEVVWKPNPSIPPSEYPTSPPEYDGPFDKIASPEPIPKIPTFELRAGSRASYSFQGKGQSGVGTIFATGPANLSLTPFSDGKTKIFQVSVCAFVTGGTGEYDGCRGVNTALGSSFLPEGVDVDKLPLHTKVPGVTVSTFRVVRKHNIG